MWKLQPKQFEQEPEISNPPSIEEVIDLIKYFRSINSADSFNGYNLCAAINRGLVTHIKQKYPSIEVKSILCKEYTGILQTPSLKVEHYVGAINTTEGWIWFDGTGDQLSIPNVPQIIIKKVESEDELIPSIEYTLGGNWRSISVRV